MTFFNDSCQMMDIEKTRKTPFPTRLPFTQTRLVEELARVQSYGLTQVEYSCTKDPGLKANIYSTTGKISLSSRYCLHKRPQRKPIGELGLITLEQARREHRANKALASQGIDPKHPAAESMTLDTLHHDHYLPQSVSRQKKSLHTDISRYTHWIGPEFGQTRLRDITVTGINQFVIKMRESGLEASTIKKIIVQLGSYLNLGIELDQITKNVVRAIRLPKIIKKPVKYMTAEQLKSVYRAAKASDDIVGSRMIMLMMLTGARLGEITAAEWSHVDLEAGIWNLPTQKSGRPGKIDLSGASKAAVEDLKAVRRNRFLCPGAKGNDQLSRPIKLFKRLCQQAGIPDTEHFTLHSLRHSWVSAGINAGVPIEIMSQGARHSSPVVTRIYAHADRASLLEAQETVSALITG